MSWPAWLRPIRAPRGRTGRRCVALAVGTALAVGLLPQYAPPAQAKTVSRPDLDEISEPVRGTVARAKRHKADPAAKAAVKSPARVSWPKPGKAGIALSGGLRQADGLPLRVGAPRAMAKAAPEDVDIQVLGRGETQAAGVDGVLLKVMRADGAQKPGKIELELDYSGFADAYGGNYGSRLRFVQYPGCLLTDPGKKACTTPYEIPAENDTKKRTLIADVTAAPGGAADNAPLLAATAAASADQGNYTATPLSPSAEWSVSNSSGAFNWSYPMRVPPTPGGLTPAVGLSYNSQATDGQTAATNTQGSWIGEGFSYEPGYIERRYKPCSSDGHDKTNGDLCWAYDNATLQLPGRAAGELIKDDDATGDVWRIKSDDNSTVERVTGGANEDDNGEYWRVTTADGTEYYFGLDRPAGWASGKAQTNSTWTAPVYGDDKDEPCYKATFADAYCTQAWRWNLDYVKDPHGNVMTYFYGRETNYYTQGLKTDENGKPYIRGGYLKRVDYGQRDGKVYSGEAPARVDFAIDERCLEAAADCEPGDLNDSTAAKYWPDVPWDRNCKADSKCPGKNSPTFWTRKKLSAVTTQIRKSGGGYTDVDSWKLTHIFTDNGDGSKSLWLNAIDHTGHVGGADISMPTVKLRGKQLANRVDQPDDNIQAMNRFRLSGVDNETGGQIDVIYKDAECTPATLPQPDSSTKRCYPVKWNPPGEDEPITDWFNKYAVDHVTQTDLTGGAPDQVSSYDYIGGAGWKMAKADGITEDKYRTRSDWRGYGEVRVTQSNGSNSVNNMRTEHTYLRGLGGDPVKDSEGGSHDDSDELSGFELETATYNGGFTSDKIVDKSINTAWSHTTATRTKTWGTTKASYVRPESTTTYTALEKGGWQQVKSTHRYDEKTGRVIETDDYGEVGVGGDNQCTRTSYADNTAQHMLSYVSRVEKVAVSCTAAVDRKTEVISDDLTFYDGKALGVAPTKGDTTKTQRIASHDGTKATYQTVTESAPADFDVYGRFTKVVNAEGKSTTATYVETDGLTTEKTETNPRGWTTKTEYAPGWGQKSSETDPNGKRSDFGYDALGRLTAVWLPDRSKTEDSSPSIKYSYLIRTDASVAVKTEKIENDETYGVEYTLYDGLLRPRQEQTEGQDGGRLIADTFYDGVGNVAKTYGTYYAKGAPSGQLFKAVPGDVDAQTFTEYDGAGRKTAEIFKVEDHEKWRTTYAYGGDRIHVDPPVGQAPTTTITDARDRTTEIRRYKGAVPLPSGTPADYESTVYAYYPDSLLKTVKDAAGSTWSYEYDQRGRKTGAVDPDTGRTTFTYDVMDRLTSATDAREKKISTVYDDLGRQISTWEGEPNTGVKQTATTYDTEAKGEVYGEYKYADGAVRSSVIYPLLDDFYQPLKTEYTLSKTAEPELGGTYVFHTEYNRDGTVQGMTLPAGGGLPSETLTYAYDSLQRPVGMGTTLDEDQYVSKTKYYNNNLPERIDLETGGTEKSPTWLAYDYERGTDRLTRTIVATDGATGYTYDARRTYDAAGNVTGIADTPADAQADVQCFTYDWERRLSEAWTTSNTSDGAGGSGVGDAACAKAPTSSTLGGPGPYWQSFTYDASGNRKTQVMHGVGGTGDTTRRYEYGDADQDGTTGEAGDGGPHNLTKVVQDKPAAGGAPAVRSLETFGYDDAGNTDKRVIGGDTQSLAWDATGKLASSQKGGVTSTFAYGADGERVLRKEADATTFYLPGMELRLDAATKSISTTRYYSFAGQTVAMRTTKDGVRFLTADPHGTAEMAIDAKTGETVRRRMDPFGNERGSGADAQSWADDKGFLGKPVDESTGFTHIGAREYEPENGRFISADPIIDFTDPQQINGYAYANNNPVTFSDPSGMKPDDCINPGVSCTPTGNGGWKMETNDNWRPQYPQTQASKKASVAREKADRAKIRAVLAAKELTQIAADELGITDALDCFTTGSLGACAATILNVATEFVGGLALKFAKKYALPTKWGKAAALGKRVWGLLKKILSNFKSWRRLDKRADELEDVARACEPNSFTPETQVLMADGTTKAIADVDIGDKVIATDPETGETPTETVTAEIKGQGTKHLVKVTVDVDGKKGKKTASVTATEGHPFWVPELHAWLKATDLKRGEWLRTSAGTYVQVTAVQRWTQRASVYNLTVGELHTYYVRAGAVPVLVHNASERCELLEIGPHARDGVALENGDIEADGVRELVNEAGNKYGCHSCGVRKSGLSSGDDNWVPDHQPPTKLVKPGTPQTAYPHCNTCYRRQGGQTRKVQAEWVK